MLIGEKDAPWMGLGGFTMKQQMIHGSTKTSEGEIERARYYSTGRSRINYILTPATSFTGTA